MSVKTIVRKQLLSVPFDNKNVTSVEVREINFEPRQEPQRLEPEVFSAICRHD
jgi:hypothetical protein